MKVTSFLASMFTALVSHLRTHHAKRNKVDGDCIIHTYKENPIVGQCK